MLNLEPYLFKENRHRVLGVFKETFGDYVEFLKVEAPDGLVDMASFHFE